MKISKIRPVKTPNRGTTKSAGIDFFIPEFNKEFINDCRIKNYECGIYINESTKTIIIHPQARVLIPSGIKVNVPEGYMLTAYNKSGVSTNKGLDLLASVVDEDYQGEIHLSLYNTSNEIVEISENEKILQFILIPVNYEIVEEVPIKDLFPKISERGEGGFGSTDKNDRN